MNDDELVHDMYSCLNLIINELNSIGLIKLGDADIVRKIIYVLPQKKYTGIITILHNIEDLSTMTTAIVIGKIVTFEMSHKMGHEEASSSSKGKALACSEHKKTKGKQVETSSSSSSKEEEDEDDDDEESINLPPPPPTLMKNQSNLSTKWRRSKNSMSRVCPSKFKISSSPIKEMSKERRDAMDAAR